MTIGELKEYLEGYPNNHKIIFGDDALTFNRLKRRGPKLVQLEFNEDVYRNEKEELIANDHSS